MRWWAVVPLQMSPASMRGLRSQHHWQMPCGLTVTGDLSIHRLLARNRAQNYHVYYRQRFWLGICAKAFLAKVRTIDEREDKHTGWCVQLEWRS